jgi:hypothetical protein
MSATARQNRCQSHTSAPRPRKPMAPTPERSGTPRHRRTASAQFRSPVPPPRQPEPPPRRSLCARSARKSPEGGRVEALARQPGLALYRPAAAALLDLAMAQHELPQPVPGPGQVLRHVQPPTCGTGPLWLLPRETARRWRRACRRGGSCPGVATLSCWSLPCRLTRWG